MLRPSKQARRQMRRAVERPMGEHGGDVTLPANALVLGNAPLVMGGAYLVLE